MTTDDGRKAMKRKPEYCWVYVGESGQITYVAPFEDMKKHNLRKFDGESGYVRARIEWPVAKKKRSKPCH